MFNYHHIAYIYTGGGRISNKSYKRLSCYGTGIVVYYPIRILYKFVDTDLNYKQFRLSFATAHRHNLTNGQRSILKGLVPQYDSLLKVND